MITLWTTTLCRRVLSGLDRQKQDTAKHYSLTQYWSIQSHFYQACYNLDIISYSLNCTWMNPAWEKWNRKALSKVLTSVLDKNLLINLSLLCGLVANCALSIRMLDVEQLPACMSSWDYMVQLQKKPLHYVALQGSYSSTFQIPITDDSLPPSAMVGFNLTMLWYPIAITEA